MKKLFVSSLVVIAAITAFAQPPVKSGNIPTDTASQNSDPIVSISDSSQFSMVDNYADDEIEQNGKKRKYKRTSTSSYSRTSRKSSASNKRK